MTSASHQKPLNLHEGKVNPAQTTIGVRQSFTQKPPTDSRQQPPMFQKNLKYLENNRMMGSSSQDSNDKFSSTGGGNSGSTKRD